MRSLVELDAQLSATLRVAEHPGWLRSVGSLLAHSADSWYWLLALGVVGVIGEAAWRRLVLEMAVGIGVTAVVVMILKFTVRRQRPEGDWGAIYRNTDPNSFPSGHAARALMLAVIALGLGPLWLGILLLTWAPLVALARVAMGVHFISDVLAGMLLGLGIGVAVIWFVM
jgi:undecaprenyl-diphosphatase